jgi:16S rRNA (guanine966-N2)-methyltransferase
MRIISGRFKGIDIISPPKSLSLRPTSDKVREAIFDIIRFEITDAMFLDLFAGSGAMGIEAISEGAKFSVFVEKNPIAVKTTRANIRRFNIEDQTLVIEYDVLRFLQTARSLGDIKENFNIVFLDPPYASRLATQTLIALADFPYLDKNSIVIAEHSREEVLDEIYKGKFTLKKFEGKKYGTIIVSYFVAL